MPLGLNRDGTLEVPRDYSQTGWYTDGPEPGETGAAVIVGHVDSKTGPAAFFRLRELRRGDAIRVARTDGSTVKFTVTRIEQWRKAAFPTARVYGRTHGPALRLVTCSGDFDPATGHYANNTIVFASPS
jgi:sortase (surface protein transpeptidase)